jgi:hypothetical protein
MMHQIARRLLVDATENPVEHSQSVKLNGRSFLTAEVRLLSAAGLSATTPLDVSIELSDDLENWVDSGLDPISFEADDPAIDRVYGVSGTAQAVNAQYARIRYETSASGTGRALVAATLDVARA